MKFLFLFFPLWQGKLIKKFEHFIIHKPKMSLTELRECDFLRLGQGQPTNFLSKKNECMWYVPTHIRQRDRKIKEKNLFTGWINLVLFSFDNTLFTFYFFAIVEISNDQSFLIAFRVALICNIAV